MSIGMNGANGGATPEDEDIVRLLGASGVLRRRRTRRLLLARLLSEGRGGESEYEEDEGHEEHEGFEEPGEGDGRVVRRLIARGVLRRRGVRRVLLAHLLRERGEGVGGSGEEYEEEEGEEVGGGEHRLARLVIASGILRRRRTRRMILAHLLRERGEGGGFGEEFGETEEPEFGSPDRKFAKLLIASGILRRRRTRRMILAHLMRERGEEFGEEEGEEGFGEGFGPRAVFAAGVGRRRRMRRLLVAHLLRERAEGGGFGEEHDEGEEEEPTGDRKIAKLIIASGILRRRRARRMVLGHLLRERGEGFGEEPEEFEEGEEGEGFGEEGRLARLAAIGGLARGRRRRRMAMGHLLREAV
jgi:hypothetical protein